LAAVGAAAWLARRHYMRYLVPMLVVLPVVAVLFLGVLEDSFMKRRVENENTVSSRVGIALTTLRIWRENPLFGIGFFNYAKVRSDYIVTEEVPLIGTIKASHRRWISIHDIYLGPLAEDGLVGAVLQALIYYLIFRKFRRQYARRREGDHVATYIVPVAAGALVGYLVGGLAIDYRFFSITGTLFFAFVGMIDGYAPERRQESPVTSGVAEIVPLRAGLGVR
jgi:O-antigen ligase